MNILARSRFISASPVFGFGIWPRNNAAFCACMMTNSMKRCESSPLRVVFWTSAIKESDQCSVTSDQLRQYITNEFARHTSVACSAVVPGEGGSLFLWRSHCRQNVRLITKIFRGYLLNMLRRHRVHVVLEPFVIVKAQTIQLVECAVIPESVIALIGNLLLSNQFLFRSR